MSWLERGAIAIALAVTGAGAAGCTDDFEGEPVVIVPTVTAGTLVVDWTIELTTDPAFCQLSFADVIRVHVFTTSGFDAGTYEQSCGAFSTSITLAPDVYSATAILVGPNGELRTTTVNIEPFSIVGNDILHVPIDFPSTSFF